MSKSLLYICLILLFGLNVWLIYTLRSKSSLESSIPGSSFNSDVQIQVENSAYVNLLRGRIQMQAKYDSIAVASSSLVMDTLGQELPLKNILQSNESVVFFFTYKHCYSCVDGAIPALESLASKIGYDKVFLLADLYEKRDILTFKAKYNSKLRIYSISDSSISTPAKALNYPFMFLLQKSSLHAKSVFFVEKDLPDVTQDYLKELTLRFTERQLVQH